MKNFAKKLSALLLSLAMVITMMPFLAAPVMAADSGAGLDVAINGTVVGSVSAEWMESNKLDPQIFPWPASQGAVWKYVLAEGPSYDGTLKKALGVDSLDEFSDAEIKGMKDGADVGGKFFLKVSEINKAVSCYALLDQNNNPITTAFGESNQDITEAKVVALEGAANVTPIIGTKQELFADYASAKAATGFSDSATSELRPYIGGDLTRTGDDLLLKKDGKVNGKAFNFVSKFSLANFDTINLIMTEPQGTGNTLTFSTTSPQQAEITFAEGQTVGKLLLDNATWESSNEAVAVVDENGLVTPKGVGSCEISAKTKEGTLGTCSVTVDEKAFVAPTPAITDGQTANVGGGTYQVTSATAKTAAFTKAANAKSATVPATVTVNGQTLEVTSIAPNAFAGTSVKTVTVKSKKLTKASVKGSLKGSKVKTVKVKVGKKKENKKFAKKYKKIFTKKNAGKKVKVK